MSIPDFDEWMSFWLNRRRSHRFMARPPRPVISFFDLSEDQQLAILEAREAQARLKIEARKNLSDRSNRIS